MGTGTDIWYCFHTRDARYRYARTCPDTATKEHSHRAVDPQCAVRWTHGQFRHVDKQRSTVSAGRHSLGEACACGSHHTVNMVDPCANRPAAGGLPKFVNPPHLNTVGKLWPGRRACMCSPTQRWRCTPCCVVALVASCRRSPFHVWGRSRQLSCGRCQVHGLPPFPEDGSAPRDS